MKIEDSPSRNKQPLVRVESYNSRASCNGGDNDDIEDVNDDDDEHDNINDESIVDDAEQRDG